MKKNQFIYRIFQHVTPNQQHGCLTIEIKNKTATTDNITITWQCDLYKNDHKWYGYKPKWEQENYNLIPLLQKIGKANFRSSIPPTEIIDFLTTQNIEHGLFIKLKDKEIRPTFDGFVSSSEILNGKFTRYDKEKFSIPAEDQANLIEQMQHQKKAIHQFNPAITS